MISRTLSKYALSTLSLLSVLGNAFSAPSTSTRAISPAPSIFRGGLQLDFVKNDGQVPGDARFVTRGNRYDLSFSPTQAEFHLQSGGSRASYFRMKWEGGRSQPEMSGLGKRKGVYHYFIGGKPDQWHRDVPAYAQVRYQEVYPHIDLLFYGNDRLMEYDFIIAPGGDPSQIRLSFDGVNEAQINAEGELALSLPDGSILLQKKPSLYQETLSGRTPVAGGYVIAGDGSVSFKVGTYNPALPLVIDPVLTYSSIWGTADSEETNGIARDKAGNLYVLTDAFNQIGKQDVLVLKLSPDGSQLLDNLVIGGLDDDIGKDLTLDADGNLYLLVSSSSRDDDSTPKIDEGFPLTENAFLPTDEFRLYQTVVCKIDSKFDNLLYSSRFYAEQPEAMALDGDNHVLIAGSTAAFYASDNAIQNRNRCEDSPALTPFVAKFDMTKSGAESLPYFTFFTGPACGSARSIAVDKDGNAYVTGHVNGQILSTVNAPQRTSGGGDDAFVAKIDPTGSDLLFATLLGGPSTDEGRGIRLDAQGNVYVAGSTYDGFPTTPGSLQPDYKGSKNTPNSAFVTMYHPNGSLGYSTYLGGTESDTATSLAVDAAGNAYVGGYSESPDFPLVNPVQKKLAGGSDAFLSVLNPAGNGLTFSTFLGGNEFDYVNRLALDEAKGTVFLAGSTASKDFPTVSPLPLPGLPADPANRGNYVSDVFLARIDLNGGGTIPQVKPGDVNGDGKVSISDATLALRAAVGLETLTATQSAAADLNHDNKVSVGDASGVLRIAVGL